PFAAGEAEEAAHGRESPPLASLRQPLASHRRQKGTHSEGIDLAGPDLAGLLAEKIAGEELEERREVVLIGAQRLRGDLPLAVEVLQVLMDEAAHRVGLRF